MPVYVAPNDPFLLEKPYNPRLLQGAREHHRTQTHPVVKGCGLSSLKSDSCGREYVPSASATKQSGHESMIAFSARSLRTPIIRTATGRKAP